MNKTSSLFQLKFFHPKHWLTWLVVGFMAVIVRLPHSAQIKVGAFIGWLAYRFASGRRHIAKVNIELCFPALSEQERRQLLKDTFRSNGIGIIETVNSWFLDPKELRKHVEIDGIFNLKQAIEKGKGVLLVGMHASTLDLCGAVLSSYVGFDVMYRRNKKNDLLEAIMTQSREKNFPSAIERDDIRSVLKCLKKGHAVWYGPDQDYGRKHSVFAPFFNIDTATITATARFAKISGAEVIFFSHYRTRDDQRYIINLSKPLLNYPTGNEVDDASLINSLVEEAILKAPDQYWWIHRRFKTRPIGEVRPY